MPAHPAHWTSRRGRDVAPHQAGSCNPVPQTVAFDGPRIWRPFALRLVEEAVRAVAPNGLALGSSGDERAPVERQSRPLQMVKATAAGSSPDRPSPTLTSPLTNQVEMRTKGRTPDFRLAFPHAVAASGPDIASVAAAENHISEAAGDGHREWPHCTTIISISTSLLSSSGVCVSGPGGCWS